MSGQASHQSPSGTWEGERKNLPGRAVVTGRKGRAEIKGLFSQLRGVTCGEPLSVSTNYLEKGRASKVTTFGTSTELFEAAGSLSLSRGLQGSQGNSGKGRENT